MRLTDLLARANAPLNAELNPDPEIEGLTADSRAVRPGFLFAALPGAKADGRDFIDQAVAQGAVAVLAPAGTKLKRQHRSVRLIQDENPRRRLALLAAAFFGRQPRQVAAVTGTSGKTSVAHFTRLLWELTGHRAASLGTLGLVPADALVFQPPSLTTPDPVALMRSLAGLATAGYEHVVMEASSHGLDQFRLDGIRPVAAAFTNLSREHLDYHADMAAYFAAKRRLFADLLAEGGTAVLNLDAPESADLLALAKQRRLKTITFGAAEAADLRLVERRPTATGQDLHLAIHGARQGVALPLIGDFQAMNVLAALGLCLATGGALPQLLLALPKLGVVPGRLEHVGTTPAGGQVYVDYAHKPAALEAVLKTIRPHVAGRLWVVFGCGGDRDRGKRPIMGAIAARLADQTIVTDDNPRSEAPAAIRQEILSAAPGALELGDRRAAIAAALLGLKQGDGLVIAGKGHESGQIVGAITHPFDDRQVARELLSQMEAA